MPEPMNNDPNQLFANPIHEEPIQIQEEVQTPEHKIPELIAQYHQLEGDSLVAYSSKVLKEHTILDAELINTMLPANSTLRVPRAAAPPAEPVAAPLSSKERRDLKKQNKKHMKEGLALTADATVYTSRICEQINEQKNDKLLSQHMISEKSHGEQIVNPHNNKTLDKRVVPIFSKRFVKDKNGGMDEESTKNMEWTNNFQDAYISGSTENMEPFLKEIVTEMLDFKIATNMFTDEYFSKHAKEMEDMGSKLTYLPNLMQDYPLYFKNMDKYDKLKVQKLLDISPYYSTAMVSIAGSNCISLGAERVTGDKFVKGKDTSAMDNHKATIAGMRPNLILEINKYNDDAEINIERLVDEEILNARDSMDVTYEEMYKKIDIIQGSDIPLLTSDYQYEIIEKHEEMIRTHPEIFAENKELITKIFNDMIHSSSLASRTFERIRAMNIVITLPATSNRMRTILFNNVAQAAVDNALYNNRTDTLSQCLRIALAVEKKPTKTAIDILNDYKQSMEKNNDDAE